MALLQSHFLSLRLDAGRGAPVFRRSRTRTTPSAGRCWDRVTPAYSLGVPQSHTSHSRHPSSCGRSRPTAPPSGPLRTRGCRQAARQASLSLGLPWQFLHGEGRFGRWRSTLGPALAPHSAPPAGSGRWSGGWAGSGSCHLRAGWTER